MSRQAVIARGRSGPTQRYSASRPRDDHVSSILQETLGNTISPSRRERIWCDSQYVSQWACLWQDTVGFLTRPEYVTNSSNDRLVVGSFADTIGQVYPVSVSADAFTSFFTTLVRKDDAGALGLAQHPTAPDTIKGRPLPPTADGGSPTEVPASSNRLQFTTSDEDDLQPVIAALPCFLPLPSGCTFPEGTPLDSPLDKFRSDFRLFEVWLQGAHYLVARNDGHSVTAGGPLFDPAGLSVTPAAFASLTLSPGLPSPPTPLSPHGALGRRVHARLASWAEDSWFLLGATIPATVSPPLAAPADPASQPVSPETLQGLVRTLGSQKSAKEQAQAKTAASVAAAYRLAFASLPPRDAADLSHATLPTLNESFQAVLDSPKPQDAAVELRQLLSGALELANSSDLAVERDVSLDAQVCTMAFANCMRSFHWLTDPLVSTTRQALETQLGILHFLTPVRQALLAQVSREVAMGPVVLSHVADDKAQLDASRQSKLYIGGKCQEGRDIYHAVCNFLKVSSLVVPAPETAMVTGKLLRYAKTLNTKHGRQFLSTFHNHPYLVIHLFQDVQHILTLYLNIATSAALRNDVRDCKPIPIANYTQASRAADSIIDRLESTIMGSGLGIFDGRPHSFEWFRPAAVQAHQSPPAHPNRVSPSSSPTGPSPPTKRPRLAGPQDQITDPDRIQASKSQGMLLFDPQAGGSQTLPLCPIRDKVPGQRAQERCCMEFMTRGYYCPLPKCPKPHISNLRRLSTDKKRTDFASFVDKTPGLSWSPGHAPSGTPSP